MLIYDSGKGVVQSIDRPEGPPKMMSIAQQAATCLKVVDLPYLKISADDNICSSVFVVGSFDRPADWAFNIFENSRHFRFRISPKGRYYTPEDTKLQVELIQGHNVPKFRKYTGPVDKIVDRILKFLQSGIQ